MVLITLSFSATPDASTQTQSVYDTEMDRFAQQIVPFGQSWALVQRLGSETDVYTLADLGNLGSGVALAGTESTGQIYKLKSISL